MTDTNMIMRRMGYPDTEQGYYVTQLREHVARQVANGLVNRSGGTWADDAESLTHEERAKHQLAFDWAADHGYAYRVENIDGKIIDTKFDLRTGKTIRKINWKYVMPSIRDTLRKYRAKIQRPFLPKNPYL